MSNHVISSEAGCSSCDRSNLSLEPKLGQTGYQQALNDFAILPLLYRLQTYSDANFDAILAALTPQEAEAIAIRLIQTLTVNLSGKLLATYLENLRCNSLDLSQSLASLQLPPAATGLPATFPNVETPRFLYGDTCFAQALPTPPVDFQWRYHRLGNRDRQILQLCAALLLLEMVLPNLA